VIAAVPSRVVRDLQDVIQAHGESVTYYESGTPTGRVVRARVAYGSSGELQNSIESYSIRVTLDARDFTARAPEKGDTIVIDGARRGVMQVFETHLGENLVAFKCGVQG